MTEKIPLLTYAYRTTYSIFYSIILLVAGLFFFPATIFALRTTPFCGVQRPTATSMAEFDLVGASYMACENQNYSIYGYLSGGSNYIKIQGGSCIILNGSCAVTYNWGSNGGILETGEISDRYITSQSKSTTTPTSLTSGLYTLFGNTVNSLTGITFDNVQSWNWGQPTPTPIPTATNTPTPTPTDTPIPTATKRSCS